MPKENLWGYFKIRHAFRWSNNMSFLGLIMKLENNFIFFLKKKNITCKFSVTNFFFLHDHFVTIIRNEIKNL